MCVIGCFFMCVITWFRVSRRGKIKAKGRGMECIYILFSLEFELSEIILQLLEKKILVEKQISKNVIENEFMLL